MGTVAEFERDLHRKSGQRFGRWHRVDLHNHSPASHDYRGEKETAIDLTAERIREADLSVVMFTDHEVLPDASFTSSVASKSGKLILRGVELNVFVNAFGKPEDKVSKNFFFHLLVGFDPEGQQDPDYWLDHIYHKCGTESRDCGSRAIKGITSSIDQVCELLQESNAIIIPAHLHSGPDAFRSRSIDDIYADREFLTHAREHFTALEVKTQKTASFFDGKHEETERLWKTCICSSYSHEPNSLGSRPCFVQMENPSFGELKAALELRFRTSLIEPSEPQSSIIGLHVQGQFFPDLWLTLSPHCNVLIGVKGSGKTSVLECLRFALGAEVPSSRKGLVDEHLNNILGPAGKVRVLVKRSDGAKILIERSQADSQFRVTFESDRQEVFSHVEPLQFPAYILGWHEIEQAATDINIRRLYMDTIAGRQRIRQLQEEASALGKQVRQRHDQAANKYEAFRSIHEQVERLEEQRRGLQELEDEDLLGLKNAFERATQHREQIAETTKQIVEAKSGGPDRLRRLLTGLDRDAFQMPSPLDAAISKARDIITALFVAVDEFGQSLDSQLGESESQFRTLEREALEKFDDYTKQYEVRVARLTEEQRQLLDSHRKVMEETKSLPRLRSERDALKSETEDALRELSELCGKVANRLQERTRIRKERVEACSQEVSEYGVRLSVVPHVRSLELDPLSQRYRDGYQVYSQLETLAPNKELHHLRLQKCYEDLGNDLINGNRVFFIYAEFGHFIGLFEEDDLKFELEVTPGNFRSIDQLSAGQRCTAIFPVLLKLEEGPLVIDQPEDNLDNRHIADKIAPALLDDKRTRQIVFTSHNANLVVLSDAEHITEFEGTGTQGQVQERGFLATRDSRITSHVLNTLDGGERALEMRYRKYGAAHN